MAQSPARKTPGGHTAARKALVAEGLQLRQGKGAEQVLPELWQRGQGGGLVVGTGLLAQVTAPDRGAAAYLFGGFGGERALALGQVGQAAGDLTPLLRQGAGGAGRLTGPAVGRAEGLRGRTGGGEDQVGENGA